MRGVDFIEKCVGPLLALCIIESRERFSAKLEENSMMVFLSVASLVVVIVMAFELERA